jgi:hypothetical protein
MKHLFGCLLLACLLIGCGDPDVGPPLGDFPAITKAATDPAFQLVAPGSRSPAPFTFTSSNAAVATIDGATVTIHGEGVSTITAAQPAQGSFGPTSKTTTLTVTATGEACPAGSTRVDGVCKPACENAGTRVGNDCIAARTVTTATMIWAGVNRSDTWTNAAAFCKNTLINNVRGWRQPTAVELAALAASGILADKGWTLGVTWTSSAADFGHAAVDLRTGAAARQEDGAPAYVSCVKDGS